MILRMYEKKKWFEVVSIISGKNQKNVVDENGEYPIYGSGGIMGYASDYLCEAGTTIVGRKGTINKPIFVNRRFWNVDTAFGITPGEELNPKYLYYFCQYFNFAALDKSTTIPSLAKRDLLAIEMPVPSLEEQQRIVARIEELFSQLDDAEATLQKTKAQLTLYRQAVLKEAFDTIDGTECCIDNVCKEIKVGIVIKPTQYYVDKDGIFAFRNANVRRGYIDDCDWVMISKEGHIKNQKSEVHAGDVLISRSGANLGMASPVPDKYDGYNAIDVVIAVPDKGAIIPAYLAYYTNSPMGRSIVKRNERGAAQGHLNVTAYGRLPIVVPSLSEQQMIIEGIDAKTSVCDSIEQTVDETLQQAKAMRQSILQRVFNE